MKDRSTPGRLARLDAGPVAAPTTDPEAIRYLHTVMCQTSIPYRDPGPDVRQWTRNNGQAAIQINAGAAWHTARAEFVPLGLPFGPKPRLLLAHLNRAALVQQSPVVEVEATLTGFVRAMRLDPTGRNIGIIRDQLARLSAATIRLGISHGAGVTINTGIVSGFELWAGQDDRPRDLWPATVRLSPDYYASLLHHAVPLADAALVALSGSALALDVYAWLAQRLPRMNRPAFIPWPAVQAQFGAGYDRVRAFRAVFVRTLAQVRREYPAARIEADERGLTLRPSPPSVARRAEKQG